MEYIGLGSNCSITHQLNSHGLRKNSFPFDWTKISLGQLIRVFENNFDDFVESLEFKKISSNHLVLEEPICFSDEKIEHEQSSSSPLGSLVLKNKYGIEFAHELGDICQINVFKKKLTNRIIRFREILSNNEIKKIFVRIELSNIKKSYEQDIMRLIELIETIGTNHKLVLIINTEDNFNFDTEKVHVYRFNEFSSDWKMEQLDWLKYFSST
jgi:hypothetical protein